MKSIIAITTTISLLALMIIPVHVYAIHQEATNEKETSYLDKLKIKQSSEAPDIDITGHLKVLTEEQMDNRSNETYDPSSEITIEENGDGSRVYTLRSK